MKTNLKVTKEKIAYINCNGVLVNTPFDGHMKSYSNLEVVAKMVENGNLTNDVLVKLNNMSSRDRSESGVYNKLQKRSTWLKAVSQITGATVNEKVLITYESTLKRDTKSRREAFRLATAWVANMAIIKRKVPYCKGEELLIIQSWKKI